MDMPRSRNGVRRGLCLVAAASALLAGSLVCVTATTASAAHRSRYGFIVHPLIARVGSARDSAEPPTTAQCLKVGFACYGPTQIETAYDEEPLFQDGVTGAGATIVVVDPFGAPDIRDDLAHFDRTYGLQSPPKLHILKYGNVPAFDRGTGTMVGWAEETTLDVEYSHATAPGANILLVETAIEETLGAKGFPTIVNAENYVINHRLGDVITQSFGEAEQTFKSPETLVPLRMAYVNAQRSRVTVLAASGDQGVADVMKTTAPAGPKYFPYPVVAWPVIDLPLTGVDDTQRPSGAQVAAFGALQTATPIGGPALASGGGYSDVFTRPSYQNSVESVFGDRRGVPDISMSASCAGSVNIYITGLATGRGWMGICGTSEASALFSGIVALADQEAHHSLGVINPALYRMSAAHDAGIVPVTRGSNSAHFTTPGTRKKLSIPGYTTHAGYNLVTGVGTVNAAFFVPELVAAAAFEIWEAGTRWRHPVRWKIRIAFERARWEVLRHLRV